MIGCNTRTVKIVAFLWGLIAATNVCSQTTNPSKLKINGAIGLNSTYTEVIKLLGKPKKETKPRREECIGGHEKTVTYDGLTFYFMDGLSKSKKTYLVMSFDLTSSKLTVSGVKIGDSETVVKNRFGKPKSVDQGASKDETTWIYEIAERQGGPGQTTIAFRNGKVSAIGSSFQVC